MLLSHHRLDIVVIIPKVYLVPVNDSPNLKVPKVKPKNTNNISYYCFYSENVPNHLLMYNIMDNNNIEMYVP